MPNTPGNPPAPDDKDDVIRRARQMIQQLRTAERVSKGMQDRVMSEMGIDEPTDGPGTPAKGS